MSHWALIYIITILLLVTLPNTEGVAGCYKYMSELPEYHLDDCTSYEDNVKTVKAKTFKSRLDGYSRKDVEFNDLSNRWRDRYFYTPKFSTKKLADQCACKKTFCDCYGNVLKHVPQDLPFDITKLDLSLNVISDLPNCTFCNYKHLTYLDLFKNKITHLNVGSFWGLLNLTILKLHYNKLLYVEQNFPVGVFFYLKSLRCLLLNHNVPNLSSSKFKYPDKVLAELINLRTLYLDGLHNVTFGEHFRKLKELRNVILAGDSNSCHIFSLSENSFKNIEQISYLDISVCKILGTASSKYAFKPLVNLVKLDVSFNEDFGVRNVLYALNSVREYNITFLKMNFMEPRLSPSIVIDSVMIQSLPRSLLYLEAKGNNFQSIDQGALQLLPPNLTYISAGDNIFLYNEYFKELSSMKSLKILELNSGRIIPTTPMSASSNSGNQKTTNVSKRHVKIEKDILYLPPKLLCLSMILTGLRYRLTKLTFHENNSLETLILNNNYIPVIQGPIYGLSKLKTLYISDCGVAKIYSPVFKNLPYLQELRLNNNNLGYYDVDYTIEPLFQFLKNLKILDLSGNFIKIIKEDVFENFTNLEELHLSKNIIDQFNITRNKMLHLRKLKLSNNHLSTLSEVMRKNIDMLLQTNHSISIDMSLNPIRCECNNIDFIKWMVKSDAFEQNLDFYHCQYEDTSIKEIYDSYEETLNSMTIKCANHSTIFFVVTSATLCLISFVAFAVLYREEAETVKHILQECPLLASYGQVGMGDPLATALYGDVNVLRSTAELISRALRDEINLSSQSKRFNEDDE